MINPMPKAALMCPPTYFYVRDVKNPHMQNAAPVDQEKARLQWQALRHALEDAGVRVEVLQPVEDLEDMVFAANLAFVGHHPKIGKFVVPSEMRFLSRQREVPSYVNWFAHHHYRIIALDLVGQCLEGHGDLIWHPDHSKIWAGHGFRTTAKALDLLSAAMGELGFPVERLQLTDPVFYHLDTCFCPLNQDSVLIYPGAFSSEALAGIRRGFTRVHELPREDAIRFMINGIVANGAYITPRLSPALQAVLDHEKLRPVVVDTSEFEKSGGSAFCMKCFIE
jgi:N-dimethylarginine dimethylaminohydrolase